MQVSRSCMLLCLFLGWTLPTQAEPPRSKDARLVMELVAQEPAIVTPTGIGVDEQGRIWVIENNTHQRPANYQGPTSDRIRIFSDFDSSGRARQATTFAEGFQNSMGLLLAGEDSVFLATRSDIWRLRHKAGSSVADQRSVIVKLDSTARYPHNGLSGFAMDGTGNLYFGLGENLGAPYTLIGSDGRKWSGGGEGGSIYRCRPDGTNLVRVATGFWNPFHLTFDAFGRMFAVDNDPDSRGPCRLLHIIQGGDYGYRYRNGRRGLHPFTAWNGELPGTLPMVAGTSEAPCAVMAYESTGLPADYRGDLLVTSWGDHAVERFHLTPRGASFTSQAQTVVSGGEDFRPVGIATAPDGSLYLSDWVDKSYPVHGKGRLWRIRMKSTPLDDGLRPSAVATLDPPRLRSLLSHGKQEVRAAAADTLAGKGPAEAAVVWLEMRSHADTRTRMQCLWALAKRDFAAARTMLEPALLDAAPEVRAEAARLYAERAGSLECVAGLCKDSDPGVRLQAILHLDGEHHVHELIPTLTDKDPFLRAAALDTLGRQAQPRLVIPALASPDPALRLGALLVLRRMGAAEGRAALPKLLADPQPSVRRAAIQWVGEEHLDEYASRLDKSAAQEPASREVFEAWLAAKDCLTRVHRKPEDEPSGETYVIPIVQSPAQPPSFRALAMRMLRPDHPALKLDLLSECLRSPNRELRREATRTLAFRAEAPAQKLLRELVTDRAADPRIRAEAVLGLAHSAATNAETRLLLLSLLTESDLQADAWRSLRSASGSPDVMKAMRDRISDGKERSSDAVQQIALSLRGQPSDEARQMQKTLEPLIGPRPHTPIQWQAALSGPADAAAGERVFFHPHGPRCFACHRVDGRGAAIGPDLSSIGAALHREKLIDSILSPSKEIAPQFVSWFITTRDGRVRTGMIVEEGPHSTITVADNQGKLEVIHRTTIEERHAVATSIMPDNLADLMTLQEFRDLLAFLESRK